MRYAILTHPLMYNYGGILQNFALQYFLRKKGYDVVTINRSAFSSNYDKIRLLNNCKIFCVKLLNIFGIHKFEIPKYLMSRYEYNILVKNINPFIVKNIQITEDVVYDKDLFKLDDLLLFDGYIVGSDQVWIPSYCPMAFLDFVKRNKLTNISYAASAGNKSWLDDLKVKERCIELSKNFKALSAREDNLAQRVSICLNRNVERLIDPTMLLSPKDYLDIINPTMDCHNKIFTYILDENEEKKKLINDISIKLGKSIVGGFSINKTLQALPSIDNWINSIYTSDYVITDSFHGCVFSIIFNKPFAIIINKKRGVERFYSLLNIFQIKDRILNSKDDIDKILNSQVDYTQVNYILNQERQKSYQFISSNLVK